MLQSKSKRLLLKTTTVIVSAVVAVTVLLAADLYLHYRHGINLRGYRGPAVGRKKGGESRIVVLGGSTTWGYGVTSEQTFPAELQRNLAYRFQSDEGQSVSVVNLGFNNEGAYSFQYTLNDYEYLDYDVVLLYSGYNDLAGPDLSVFRNRSPVFRRTGYLPLLPEFTAAKISAWKARLSNRSEPTVFVPRRPNESGKLESEIRDQTSKSLEKQLGQLTTSGQSDERALEADCAGQWEFYCRQIFAATNLALTRGKRVIIVTEPYISDQHVMQQKALESMLKKRFESRINLSYVNLGRRVDLRDASLCWDGMHLTEEGNRRIAEALSQPVLEMLRR